MLDWDVVVEYEGEQVACGDLKPIFGKNEIEEGSESCSNITETYRDVCCYTPPVTPCNLCQTETDFLDAYSSIEVEFWGSVNNCSEVYDYLIRRIESDSETCSSAKDSLKSDCCYKKCTICGEGSFQDFYETVELDGATISCLQLHTVRTLDVAQNSEICSSMQSQFSESCCYDAPETPCMLCTEGAVRKVVEVDFRGKSETCDNVANYLASRSNNGTDECTSSVLDYGEYCCFDKCSLCKDDELVDWDSYVTFEEKDGVSCGSFDWYFTSNSIEEGTPQCTDVQSSFREKCCYKQINYSIPACSLCKKNEIWYDLNGVVEVDFEGTSRTCTEVSNSLFRKAEDSSELCGQARKQYFDQCCFEKCNLCGDAQLDAKVEVLYNNTARTCLELAFTFVSDIVQEGSDKCNAAKEGENDVSVISLPYSF